MSPKSRTFSAQGRSIKLRFAAVPAAALAMLAGCSGTPESRETAHMAKGKRYFAEKNYRRAVVEFKVASQNMPKDAEPLYQLGMTYLTAGAARQAYETFVKATTANPKHARSLYQIALFHVGSNKPELVEEARQALSEHVSANPGDAEARGSLALAEAKLGNKEEALKQLRLALQKNPSNIRPAAVIIALFAAKGDTDTAKSIARDLSATQPNSPDAAVLRAEVSLAMKDTADADAEIGHALALKRNFRPALQLRMRRELMTGDTGAAEKTSQEMAKLPEKSMWSAYARMLFAENKIPPGIAEFDRVLKEHPDDAELRDQYSALLMGAGKKKEAQAIVAGTLSKNAKDRTALLQRITLLIDRGDIENASKDVKTLLELKANSAPLSYQQSRIFAVRGDTVRQGDLLTETLKYDPGFLPARLDLTRLLLTAGKGKAALEILDQGAPADKNTAEYAYFRNMALIADNNIAEARKGVDAALAKTRSPGFLLQDALLKVQSKDLAGARKSLDAALQIAPADPGTLGLLGQVMQQQGDSAKFLALLQEAAAKNPGSAPLQNMLGARLASQGDQAGARAAFEKSKSAGDAANAEAELAFLDMKNGALDQAGRRLRELIRTHDSAKARMLLAEVEARKNMPAEGIIQHYLKAIQFEPTNIPAMNNLADILSRQNKFDDALFWAQKANALAPESPVVADTVGWIYYRQNKFEAALPFLEKSLKGLDRPVAHYHLAAALLKTGDPKRGRREYELGLKQDPNSPAKTAVAPLFGGVN
jgi:tetratricopeptide (TPR) repeat protein